MKSTKLKADHRDLELQEEMSEQELADYIELLWRLPNPPVSDAFVSEALYRWQQREGRGPLPVEPVPMTIFQRLNVLISHQLWWSLLLGCLLTVAGFVFLKASLLLPESLILPVIGCIPMFVMVSHTAKQFQWGMGELARSLRFPIHTYILARLCCAALISLLISISISMGVFSIGSGEVMLRQILLWCIPVFMNTGIALMLSMSIRHYGHFSLALMLIPFSWIVMLSIEKVSTWVISLATEWLFAVAIFSVISLFTVIYGKLMRKSEWQFGG